VLAVVPFGTRDADPATAAIARQLARRVVERFERGGPLEAKPVFLVAMSDGAASGVLVLGSTPDAKLAAEYARGLGATHALFGIASASTLRATLVDAADGREIDAFDVPVDPDSLPQAEGALAAAVARALGEARSEEVAGRLAEPPTSSADGYRSLLLGMDFELTAGVLQRDRPDDAEAALREARGRYLDALRADPALAPAEERLLYIVAESLERGDNERAVELLEEVIAVAPRSWRAHYMLGELRIQAGLISQAVVAFEHADALHRLSDADSLRLSQLYLESNAPEAAAARLRRIAPGSAHYAGAQEQLGLAALAREDIRGATVAFERARAAGGAGGMLFARLAQCYVSLGDKAKARAAFEEGLASGDRSWPLLAAYAAFLHGEADLPRAIGLYREAIAQGAPAPARLNLARALLVSGHREDGRRELEAVISDGADTETLAHARRLRFGVDHPEDESRLEDAGQVAVGARDGDASAARDTLAAIADRNRELWEAHFGLGVVERRLGNAASAESALRKALELWPAQPDVLHELGVALLSQGKIDDAVLTLEQAAHERPDDAGYLADAGFARMAAGDLFTARTRLERARAMDPDDGIIRGYLAELDRREASTRVS
jgi:Tfp pilus assembly protein PilF